jgi:hypothetical protein
MHVDQVSFALAMRQLNLEVDHLSMAWNFPTHKPAALIADQHDISPQILHYHRSMTARWYIKPVGVLNVDAAIDRLNASISCFLSESAIEFGALSA